MPAAPPDGCHSPHHDEPPAHLDELNDVGEEDDGKQDVDAREEAAGLRVDRNVPVADGGCASAGVQWMDERRANRPNVTPASTCNPTAVTED